MSKKNKIDYKEVVKAQIYNQSPIITEEYPNVSSITIKKELLDDSGIKKIGETIIWKIPIKTMRMRVEIECLRSCVDGGFNLTNDLKEMIKNKETQRKNSIVCQGWQDENRIGHFHCLTTLKYEIEISYN